MRRSIGVFGLFCALSTLLPLSTAAQTPDCSIAIDALDWASVVPKPLPPEKTVDPIPDAGINPAQVANTKVQPYSLAGQFLSSVNNIKRYCTGQFVSPNIVLTAAHCVRDKDGTWLDRFELSLREPAERSISTAKCVVTPSNWVTGANGSFHWPADYAFVVLERNETEMFLDIEIQPSKDDEFVEVIGFPKGIDDGKFLTTVVGKFFESRELGVEPVVGEGTGIVVHGEPRYGLGISGGGWIVPPKPDGESKMFRVLGVNASSALTASAGARFGACALKALEVAKRGCDLKP